jgi:hypothetical protein
MAAARKDCGAPFPARWSKPRLAAPDRLRIRVKSNRHICTASAESGRSADTMGEAMRKKAAVPGPMGPSTQGGN